MADQRIFVAQDTLSAAGENSWMAAKGNKLGYQIVIDFYTQMAIEGRVFQITAGTISEPLVGDVLIIDAKAEMAVDVTSGTTIIPCAVNIGVNIAPGTANEFAGKSVATVSSGGDAFVPLNLKSDGPSAVSTARVDAAGGVTVTAELSTTTLLHFAKGSAIAAGAYAINVDWQPKAPPVLVGARCFYVQCGGAVTGPSYFANIDYIELPTANIS